ncbi:MAG TPA: menaquinone biosynthesis protein [Gemmatimonadota bacterium]|jgi:chorismate dehydratase
MLALGHIAYANCFPVHGPLLLGDVPFGGEVVTGDPGLLNRLLATGRVQVAPCSSIEYARHYPRYRLLPDLSISSRGEVRSILLTATRAPEDLGRCRVGLPTASASSACLAEILLRRRWGAEPELVWFEQLQEEPLERCDAALYIGDAALRLRRERPDLVWTDLGSVWTEWTGLPFVYALWQVHAPPALAEDVAACARAVAESKAAGLDDLDGLARRYPDPFPLSTSELAAYWRALDYGLGAEVREGLRAFYALAVEIGRLERVPPLQLSGGIAASVPL